ncbi:hypothetical protein IAU60_006305 [Kwoniella sp. DSM 27419]
MKFTTNSLILTSLAFSSASLAAPLPPLPNSSAFANNLDVSKSPKVDDYDVANSPSFPSPNPAGAGPGDGGAGASSPLIGLDLGQVGGAGRGLGVDVGGLLGVGDRRARRQLPAIPSPTNPVPPINAQAQVPTSVPMSSQPAQSGDGGQVEQIAEQGVDGLTGQVQGLGLGPAQGAAQAVPGLAGVGLLGGLVNGLPVQGMSGLTGGLPLGVVGGTLGGLTNGLPLQGLTNTAGGLTSGLPVQGLTGTLGGLTSGLPLQGITGTVAGLTNGLPLQPLTGTLGGLTAGLPLQGVTGTVAGLTNSLPLQGLAGTLGGLTAGLPLQGVAGILQTPTGATGSLAGLSQPVQGVLGSLSSDPSQAAQALAGTVDPAAAGDAQKLLSTASIPLNLPSGSGAAPVSALDEIKSLGGGTYLLSSGQVVKLASDSPSMVASTTPAAPSVPLGQLPGAGAASPVMNSMTSALRTVNIQGRLYILNSLGQVVGTLPANGLTGSFYSDPSGAPADPDADVSGDGSEGDTGPSDRGSEADPGSATGPDDGPWQPPSGLVPLADQPDATDLIASSMSGVEGGSPFPTYGTNQAGDNSSTEKSNAQKPGGPRYASGAGSRTTTVAGYYPTASATTSNTAAATASATATGSVATEDQSPGSWYGTAPFPTAIATASATVTASATATETDWDQWAEPTGAVGGDMVPQLSSGLA